MMGPWEQRYVAGALCMAILAPNAPESAGLVEMVIGTVLWPFAVIIAMIAGIIN